VKAVVKVGTKRQQGAEARDGTVWIPNQNDNTLSVIDPAGNAVTRTVTTGPGPFVVRQGVRAHVDRKLQRHRRLADRP
jgi:YVTN family beta-propeller protein